MAMVVVACSDDSDMEEYSPQPITLDISMDESKEGYSRSILFERDSDIINHSAGGSLWLNAYIHGKTDEQNNPLQYIDSRVWYNADYAKEHPDGQHWWFLEGDDKTGYTYQVYWPKNEKLNVFAYMPYNYEDYNKRVENSNEYTYKVTPQYDMEDGAVIDFLMPETYAFEDDHQEFVYAYVPEASQPHLGLNFIHPVSTISFRLSSRSYRLKINKMEIKYVLNDDETVVPENKEFKLRGTYSCNINTKTNLSVIVDNYSDYWTYTKSGALTMNINKSVPAEINYNRVFGGPYLVLPQTIDERLALVVDAQRIDASSVPYHPILFLKTNKVTEWEPGKRYTYNLNLGDGMEEMVLDVDVEDWIVNEYKNVIEVE